jgi:hypothetical protein
MGRTEGAQGEEGGGEREEEGRARSKLIRVQVEPSLGGWDGGNEGLIALGSSRGTRQRLPQGPLGLKVSREPGLAWHWERTSRTSSAVPDKMVRISLPNMRPPPRGTPGREVGGEKGHPVLYGPGRPRYSGMG